MQAEQVVSLYYELEAHGIEVWLMGGWGVDALLHRQTRDHHDLDVLVEVAALERLLRRLGELGFELLYLWDDETCWVRDAAWSETDEHPTAFVYGHPDGGELDVHVLRLEDDGTVTSLWRSPYELTADGLQGQGLVTGHAVCCLTVAQQRAAHTGYELPPHHVADLELLIGA